MTLVRTAAWPLLTILVALAALIAAPRPAHGCTCLEYPMSGYIDRADVIFAGRQVQRIGPDDPSFHSALSRPGGETIIFEVDRVFKGQAGPLLAARSSYGGDSCGFEVFWTDTAVILARIRGMYGPARSEPGDLQVGLCGSWFPVNEIEEELGPGYPPDETMVEVAELLENPEGTTTAIAPSPNSNGISTTALYLLIGGATVILVGGAVLAFRPGIRAAAYGFIRAWYWSRNGVGTSPRRTSDDR